MRRRGGATLAVGLALAAAAVVTALTVTYPTTLAVFLLVWLLTGAAVYLVILGAVRLRSRDDGRPVPPRHAVVPGQAGGPGARSWRCAHLGHREVFRARTADRPPHWRCERCGAWSEGRLGGRRAWLCSLPLVDHVYAEVGATEAAPAHWRCVRCGEVRYRPPTSVGETLLATKVLTNWIKHGEDM